MIDVQGINLFGSAQARAYHDGLVGTFQFLAKYPHAARERTEIGNPVRIHRYQSHVIVYRIVDDGIRILRIRHGREDWSQDPFD